MITIKDFIKENNNNNDHTKLIVSLGDKICIYYYNKLLNNTTADNYFDIFEKNLVYNPAEESKVFVWNKEYLISRKQVAYGDNGTFYKFAGNTVWAKDWYQDNIICNTIRKIKDRVELYMGVKFNFVLINRYKDGNDYIGFHSDDEADLDKKAPIVGVSLGAQRPIQFKNISNKVIPKTYPSLIELELENGSLFSMNYPTNEYWKHSIPKRTKISKPRISLTFRKLDI